MNPLNRMTINLYPTWGNQDQTEFNRKIDVWRDEKIGDPEHGNRIAAAEKIKSYYATKGTTLDLSRNQLRSIPLELGSLTSLAHLNLSFNQLTSIPSELGSLTSLTSLNLYNNQLRSIPAELDKLISLTHLDLSFNHLISIPVELDKLTSLTRFYLYNNQLTSISPELGNLTSLTHLYLSNNTALVDLPMSLGGLINLTDIDIDGTGIDISIKNAILQACQTLRARQSSVLLPGKLNIWIAFSGLNAQTIQSEMNQLSDEQKATIYEWLIRLERTKDFNRCQRDLAKIVISILGTVTQNAEFKEQFFIQTDANLTDCGDRAAMNLNELYTGQQIAELPDDALLEKKLELLTRGAKTIALRVEIAKLIEAQSTDQGESVEIYLYYESTLRKELNLLTAIQHTLYGDNIGKRDWINKETLKRSVEATFFDQLCNFDLFEKLCNQDQRYLDEYTAIQDAVGGNLAALLEDREVSEDDKLRGTKKIKTERETSKKALMRKWYQENYQQ